MRLFEHEAKALLAKAGVAVPRGVVATTPQEARAAAETLGGQGARGFVVKAQVLAGGRGKAGGVRLCDTPEAVEQAANALLGARLITAQTGPEGEAVHAMLVEEQLAIAREHYLAFTLDRRCGQVALVAARTGGVEIEAIARRDPKAVLHAPVQDAPLDAALVARVLGHLGAADDAALGEMLEAMRALVWARDLLLLEINPLVRTEDGRWLAADAKIVVDDNALFRQPELAPLAENRTDDAREAEARRLGLSYVRLAGTIGCMVNGAGLAMATMDLIKLHGAEPANFLDVGGGVREEAVAAGMRLLLSDPHVRAVLVNIFGGIVRCDLIARGVVRAVADTGARLPIVLRLVGTNEEEGRRIVAEAGIPVRWARELNEAARLAVEAAR